MASGKQQRQAASRETESAALTLTPPEIALPAATSATAAHPSAHLPSSSSHPLHALPTASSHSALHPLTTLSTWPACRLLLLLDDGKSVVSVGNSVVLVGNQSFS